MGSYMILTLELSCMFLYNLYVYLFNIQGSAIYLSLVCKLKHECRRLRHFLAVQAAEVQED